MSNIDNLKDKVKPQLEKSTLKEINNRVTALEENQQNILDMIQRRDF